MPNNLYDTALHNLILMRDAENGCLHKKNFVRKDGSQLKDKSEVISFLLELDLIETENDPEVYFLCTETYELLESGDIEAQLWHKIYPEGNIAEDDRRENRELSYSFTEAPTKKTEKPPLLSGASRIVIAAVLAGIIGLIYYISPLNAPEPKPDNSIQWPEEVIFLNENGDTINMKK